MRASIRDQGALTAVSPAALSAYALAEGWRKTDIFGDHSDVYTSEGLPEIILPRHKSLGDYASVVSRLIEIFARVADKDELTLYRDLVTADRDIIRVRAAESDDGSVAARDGIRLLNGTRKMLQTAAYSLRNPQPFYHASKYKYINSCLNRFRMGQTEQDSFAITLLSPVVPPPMQRALSMEFGLDDDSIERRMTKRLAGALAATLQATRKTVEGDTEAFSSAVEDGVSANLCEALVEVIEPFQMLDVSLTWARTRPIDRHREVIRFAANDAHILRDAARSFRGHELRPNVRLIGIVERLRRNKRKTEEIVAIQSSIDEQDQSVTAVLEQSDYERAVQAHKDKAKVIVLGDLERVGQRWRMLNPRIADVIQSKDSPNESE